LYTSWYGILLIIAGNYGSVHPIENKSYTELEYEYALSTGKPIIGLIHKDIGQIPSNKTDHANADKLRDFTNRVKTSRIVKFWANGDELSAMLLTSLQHSFKTGKAKGWIREGEVPYVSLLEENHHLRSEIEQTKSLFNTKRHEDSLSIILENSDRENRFLSQLKFHYRRATVDEIESWKEGYEANGNSAFNIVIYDVLFVTGHLILPSLHGANSANLLISEGSSVSMLDKDLGHSTVFFMDGFRIISPFSRT
jgi:hypothetical protein